MPLGHAAKTAHIKALPHKWADCHALFFITQMPVLADLIPAQLSRPRIGGSKW
jgi:hypothetical protein